MQAIGGTASYASYYHLLQTVPPSPTLVLHSHKSSHCPSNNKNRWLNNPQCPGAQPSPWCLRRRRRGVRASEQDGGLLWSKSRGDSPTSNTDEDPQHSRLSSQHYRPSPQQCTPADPGSLPSITFAFTNTPTPSSLISESIHMHDSGSLSSSSDTAAANDTSAEVDSLDSPAQPVEHRACTPTQQQQQNSAPNDLPSSAPSSSLPSIFSAHRKTPRPPTYSSSTTPDAAQTPLTPSPHSSASPYLHAHGTTSPQRFLSNSEGGGPQVDAAVARAQEALSQLEIELDNIPQLPSASIPANELPMPPLRHKGALARTMAVSRTVALLVAGGVALVASHAFGLAVQLLSAVAGALVIAVWGHRRGSLSASGAVVAFMVGVGTLCCSLRFGATLLAFFYASSQLSHFKEDMKAKLDDGASKGGQRDWKQVLCNGLVPTGIAVAYGLVAGCVDVPLGPSAQLEMWRAKVLTLLGGAYLGWYACCCGDTWASEVGPLSPASPRLITSMRPVRRGTNGGVTVLGLAASAAGGIFMGLVFYLAGLVSPTLWIFEVQRATAAAQWLLLPLGMLAGLIGSLVDSLLGATVQFTGFNHKTQCVTSTPGPGVTCISGMPVLDNNLVNVVSASITASLTACAAFWLFGV